MNDGAMWGTIGAVFGSMVGLIGAFYGMHRAFRPLGRRAIWFMIKSAGSLFAGITVVISLIIMLPDPFNLLPIIPLVLGLVFWALYVGQYFASIIEEKTQRNPDRAPASS